MKKKELDKLPRQSKKYRQEAVFKCPAKNDPISCGSCPHCMFFKGELLCTYLA